MDDLAIYHEMRQIIETMPPSFDLPLSAKDRRWIGRAGAIIEEIGSVLDTPAFNSAVRQLQGPSIRSHSAGEQELHVLIYKMLAKAELRAPIVARGSFIPAGHHLDAFAAIGKVLSQARNDVMIVDPYMDSVAVSDFCALIGEGVDIRLLSDGAHVKDSLAPAAQRWRQQYDAQRPLEVRIAAPRTLHDRLILIDNTDAWILTQSLKDFAARSPGSISRADLEAASLKIDFYKGAWNVAQAL